MTNQVKFVPAPSAHYAEEGQSLPFRMALCSRDDSGTVYGLHDFFKCRDFVAEALFSEQIGKPLSIYSFGWKDHYESKPLLNDERLHVAVRGDLETFRTNLPKLWEFEASNSLSPTDVFDIEDDDSTLVLSADPGWRKSVTLLNLYTLVIKSLQFNVETDGDTFEDLVEGIMKSQVSSYSRESMYWQQITQTEGTSGIGRLVEYRDHVFDIDWTKFSDTNTMTLHHCHGPVAFFTAVSWIREGGDANDACEVIRESVRRFCGEAA